MSLSFGERVGVPWLGFTCGVCPYCSLGRENLCDRPLFTGYTRDGGYATHTVADAHYSFPLPQDGDAAALAPLLCAGLIGWRSYRLASENTRLRSLGLYGFGAAAHILAQVASNHEIRVYAFRRTGDIADVAIQDLRRWKRWEYTKQIVACYDKKSHQSPIVKNGIVRYALVCPLPEARTLLERVRRQDPELVRDLEEQLLLDTKK